MKPYIGVSCITTQEQIRTALAAIPLNPQHQLMIGLSASTKSIRDLPLSPKWQPRMADPTQFKNLLFTDKRILNLVHFAADDDNNLISDLTTIHQLVESGNLHGFQLNLVWPRPKVLETYRSLYPNMNLILNLFPPSLAAVDNDLNKVLSRLRDYRSLIDGVLIDSSGGQGKILDTEFAYLVIASRSDFNFSLGVAGGLTPDNLDLLLPLKESFSFLSIDAESGLRSDNQLDPDKVTRYLHRAYQLLG